MVNRAPKTREKPISEELLCITQELIEAEANERALEKQLRLVREYRMALLVREQEVRIKLGQHMVLLLGSIQCFASVGQLLS